MSNLIIGIIIGIFIGFAIGFFGAALFRANGKDEEQNCTKSIK